MLLLPDGTVMAKTSSGSCSDGTGSLWVKLTPDNKGSYLNGTWSTTLPATHNTIEPIQLKLIPVFGKYISKKKTAD